MSQWAGVRAYVATLAWPFVALSAVTGLLAVSAATMTWRSALAGVGHAVPPNTAANVYLGGVLAKYIPGSVWAFVLQMELGKRARLPRSAVLLASQVQAGIDSTVALVLGPLSLLPLPRCYSSYRRCSMATQRWRSPRSCSPRWPWCSPTRGS